MSDEQSMAYCSTCGPYTKIDEDGCCAYCGEDAEPIPANAEEMAKEISDLRALAVQLAEALRDVERTVRYELPLPPDHICGADTQCDQSCADFYYASKRHRAVVDALAAAKKAGLIK